MKQLNWFKPKSLFMRFRTQYVFTFRDPCYLCELSVELISSNGILRILFWMLIFFPLWEECFFFPPFIVKLPHTLKSYIDKNGIFLNKDPCKDHRGQDRLLPASQNPPSASSHHHNYPLELDINIILRFIVLSLKFTSLNNRVYVCPFWTLYKWNRLVYIFDFVLLWSGISSGI